MRRRVEPFVTGVTAVTVVTFVEVLDVESAVAVSVGVVFRIF